MSGICGVWSMGEDPVELDQLLSGLERRGPDRTGNWAAGPIALGHTLLATTPEAVGEILPLTDAKSGCTISADVRLDNRAELIAALGLDGTLVGDGELILLAYLKWGDDCPTHLLGDFAFAIWDPAAERLFCARDHMGMRQLLYFHDPSRLFAFSTEADALVAHRSVPKRINQGRIADFLDGLEGVDTVSTFFDQVFRLPAAHLLIVDRKGLALRRYWELRPGPLLELGSDQEYADAFSKVFGKAVRCRLRSARPVGAMLSGGLDSNAVSAVAGGLLADAGHGPLRTFSAVDSDSADCAESDAIRLAAGSPLFSPTLIRSDDFARWGPDVLPATKQCAEPFDAYLVISKALYGAARRQDINVMLDGVGADVVLTAGNRVAGMLSAGNFGAATREARLEGAFWGPTWPAWKILSSACWATFAPSWMRQLRWRLGWWTADRRMRKGNGNVSTEFAATVDLTARRHRFRRQTPMDASHVPAYRARSVAHPHLVAARERYDRVAAAFGIEPRDPFMDIRVIQFALSLPSSQMQDGGWPKTVLRRAMEGRIPAEIAWRRGKSHVGWAFMTKLIAHWGAQPADASGFKLVEPLVGSKLRSAIASQEKGAGWVKLSILSNWLNRRTKTG